MNYLSSTIIKSLLIACSLFFIQECTFDQSVTNIYLVRHADRDGRPDVLNEAGIKRAQDLKELLKNKNLDAIFSSKYNRTQSTAQPLADALGLSLIIYDAADINGLAKNVKANYKGKKILIVGHSNTVPATINAFGVKPAIADIDHDSYNNFFHVVYKNDDKVELIKSSYGD